MNYRLQMLLDYAVFLILFIVGSFQLLISLWHTTEIYNFSSPLTAILIFIIMLSGLANIMNGFAFSKSHSKINFVLLIIISLLYMTMIFLYIRLVVVEEATNVNVEYTFGLLRSIIIMSVSGISVFIASLISVKQMKSGGYEKG